MPYVNIKVTDTGVTDEQKARLIAGVTQVLAEVLDKHPDSTYVVIDEVPLNNWGVGGVTVPEYAARKAAASS